MVCQVYTVPTNKAYISVKFGASPGKPRMFLCSFNVAGVVFKSKTDGGGRGELVLLWTFPLSKMWLTLNLYKPEHLQPVPLCNIRTCVPASIHLLERKCSWFLLPSGLCGYCKFNLLDKTPGGSDPSWILCKKHTTNSGRRVRTAHPNTSSSRWLVPLPLPCRHRAGLSKHTHTRTDTHTISSCPVSTPTAEEVKRSADWNVLGKNLLDQKEEEWHSEVRGGWLLPKERAAPRSQDVLI